MPDSVNKKLLSVQDYHQQTKHRIDGYARGPETIDWDQQPDPFRRFEGAPIIELPLLKFGTAEAPQRFTEIGLNTLLQPETIAVEQPNLDAIAAWLEHSLALSAWKQYGNARWSMRCNPSSGNLHPSEAYLIIAGLPDIADGVYHYRADLHALELRCEFAAPIQAEVPMLLIGLSSIHWREAWKYGERAYRYCQLDIGHAIAALAYGAALNGWGIMPCSIADDSLERILGLDRSDEFIAQEAEWGDCLLQVDVGSGVNPLPLDQLLSAAVDGIWQGQALELDPKHFYQWPVIGEVAELSRVTSSSELQVLQQAGVEAGTGVRRWQQPLPGQYRDPLSRVIRQRRSAQAFDGYTTIAADALFVMLDHLLPRSDLTPWNALPNGPALHCVFFIHRVDGLTPGLYVFPRSDVGEALLRKNLRQEFLWQTVDEAPDHLPFFRLISAKAERTAAKLCCQQPIAGDSAFSLGMLAEFDSQLNGCPWRYRELFWEAGAIGQTLYLEAEAIGLRGTGIGCFFDDGVHDLLGIQGTELQSLYHFTVGGALTDQRIVSLPPYSNRRR